MKRRKTTKVAAARKRGRRKAERAVRKQKVARPIDEEKANKTVGKRKVGSKVAAKNAGVKKKITKKTAGKLATKNVGKKKGGKPAAKKVGKGKADKLGGKTRSKTKISDQNTDKTPQTERALGIAPAVALGSEGVHVEERLRDNAEFKADFKDRLPSNLVPLSRLRREALWSFELIDALAAAQSPEAGSSVVGATRIIAVPKAAGGVKPADVELATYRNSSGLLILRTRMMADRKPHLVPLLGHGTLDPDELAEIRIDNDFYQPEMLARDRLQPVNRIVLFRLERIPLPSDPHGSRALLVGTAPGDFAPGAGVRVGQPELNGIGAATTIDDQRRFVLSSPANQLLVMRVKDREPPAFTVRLDFEAKAPADLTLKLTYRVTRLDDADDAGALPGANNTKRTKLIELDQPPPDGSPIQAKDVPPVALVLS